MADFETIRRAMGAIPPRILREAALIVQREGGWVDHPSDPGGATKHGISIRYARSRGTMFDLDRDGDVDADDIRLVTPDVAVAAFLLDFYLVPGFDRLPAVVQPSVFDMAVNAGPATAVRLLQKMFNRLRAGDAALAREISPLAEDGRIGPRTLSALGTAASRFGNRLVGEYADERITHYRALVARNPALGAFLRGWENRARHAAKE